MHRETYNSCQDLRQREVELPEAFVDTTFRMQAAFHERQTVDLECPKYTILKAAERCFLLCVALAVWYLPEPTLRHAEAGAAP